MTKTIAKSLKRKKAEICQTLMAEGIISENDDNYVFLKDYLFSSPSGAASVLTGSSRNGQSVWKNKKGQSLKEIETS